MTDFTWNAALLAVVAGITTALAMRPVALGMRRLFQPADNAKRGRGQDGADPLARRASRQYRALQAGAAILATGPWYLGFSAFDSELHRGPHDLVFRFLPARLLWFAAAWGAGILTADAVDRVVVPRFGGLFPSMRRKVQSEYGPGLRKFERIALPFLWAFLAIGVFFLSNTYVYATSSRLIIRGFLNTRERSYAYSSVSWIGTAPEVLQTSGRVTKKRVFVFRFADGSSWSTYEDLSMSSPSVYVALAHYVSEQSSVPIHDLSILRGNQL
jgi:hypothetical protein